MRAIAACSLLSIASGFAAGQDSKSLPPNVQGTIDAWDALTNNRPKDAVGKADQVIDDFKAQAESMQAELKSKNTPAPRVGKPVNEKEKAAILDRGPLNDVATCYYIKGQALERLKDTADAKQAYEAACRLTYARTWDTHGWFWDPSEKSCRLMRRIRDVR